MYIFKEMENHDYISILISTKEKHYVNFVHQEIPKICTNFPLQFYILCRYSGYDPRAVGIREFS